MAEKHVLEFGFFIDSGASLLLNHSIQNSNSEWCVRVFKSERYFGRTDIEYFEELFYGEKKDICWELKGIDKQPRSFNVCMKLKFYEQSDRQGFKRYFDICRAKFLSPSSILFGKESDAFQYLTLKHCENIVDFKIQQSELKSALCDYNNMRFVMKPFILIDNTTFIPLN